MKPVRFFRLVWRINAVLLLIAGLIGVVMLAAGAVFLVQQALGTHRVMDIVRDDTKTVREENMRLFEPQVYPGSFRILALHATQSYSLSSMDKESTSTRNLALIDLDTGVNHWLLPDNKRLVLEWQVLDVDGRVQDRWGDAPLKKPVWLIAEIVMQDTNNDGVLSYEDLRKLVLVRIEDMKQFILADKMERAVSHHLAKSRYTGVYQGKDGPRRLVYDLASSRVMSDNPLEVAKP